MKVAYATIVYKNRRQNYYLFLYEPQFSAIFYKMIFTEKIVSFYSFVQVMVRPKAGMPTYPLIFSVLSPSNHILHL